MNNPLEFFISEIENENPIVKVNAINRLPIIVYAYDNPESKKKEILNYLEKYEAKCDFDEVIFGLARVLGELAEYFKMDMMNLL